MKKRYLQLLSVGLLVVFLVSLFALPTQARTQQEVQKEIAAQKKVLEEMEKKIASSETSKEEAKKELENYQKEMDKLVVLIDEKEKLIEGIGAELDAKTEELAQTVVDIQQNKELYGERLVVMYRMSNATAISSLLGVESFSELVRLTDALRRIGEHDVALLDQMEQQQKDYEQQKADIEQIIENLSAELDSLNSDRDWCADKIWQMQQKIKDADLTIKNSESTTKKSEAEIKRLQQEMDAIFAESQNKGSSAGDGTQRPQGNLLWPVNGGRISGHFGDPRDNTVYHYGLDIAASSGTSIYAAASGRVTLAGWGDSYGNYIIIDHGGGLRTLYAHCSALYVSAGATVERGATIAAVGNTGDSYGAHLHFEVHDGGQRKNPLASGYLNP